MGLDYECSIDHYLSFGGDGRLYLSESYICFCSLGSTSVISFHEITSIKKMTKHTIPNAIKINTVLQVYIFTAFPLRDKVYEAIYNTWQRWARKPIRCSCGKEGDHFKEVVVDAVIPGAPETIYDLMFTSDFLKEFMARDETLTDIQISDWYTEQPDSQLLGRDYRDITYSQFGIKRVLKDEALHVDFDDYVSIQTTMRLPHSMDNEIIIQTRTCIMWAGATVSRLMVTRTILQGCEDNRSLSGLQNLIMRDQKDHYVNLEKAIYSRIRTHHVDLGPDRVIDREDPEMTQGHGILPLPPSARTYITGPLDKIPKAAQLTSIPAKDSTDRLNNNKYFINECTLRSALAGHTSTSQYPDKVADILQSESPQCVASVMYGYLIHHGCLDLESSIDPSGFSLSPVAEGGFGDVWTGRSRTDGTKLAIKVLRFASLTGDTARKELKRITREIYHWSKLDHENVNKLIGVIIFRERLGMVSEWMEHGNLRQYLNRNA
ncbi:unnamed protein product, partial [Rhizoctonia solani]